ncbi:MAG: hypothetical protein QM820_58120 [Minicystis sp.]
MTTEPAIDIRDIRVETALPIARQIELAQWSILMLRLTVLSDLGSYASEEGHGVRALADLAECAALETRELSFRRLFRWIKATGRERVGKALPEDEYERLSSDLHQDDAG